MKITTKEEIIQKAKWLREKIKEWEQRFQRTKKDLIYVTRKEKEEVFGTLEAVEEALAIKKKI